MYGKNASSTSVGSGDDLDLYSLRPPLPPGSGNTSKMTEEKKAEEKKAEEKKAEKKKAKEGMAEETSQTGRRTQLFESPERGGTGIDFSSTTSAFDRIPSRKK